MQRKLQRNLLRNLGERYKHATMVIVDRADGRYAWAVQCSRSAKYLIGPRGRFEGEEQAWQAGWAEVRRRA